VCAEVTDKQPAAGSCRARSGAERRPSLP